MHCEAMLRFRRIAVGLRRVFVVSAVAAVFAPLPAAAQQTGSVAGTVIGGEDRQPLPSVQVFVEGTSLGTTTTAEGRFLLTSVPAGPQVIVAELIGYGQERVEVTVTAGGAVTADFELSARAVEMEGLVVTGTAIAAQRREIGNSIALITADDINPSPVTSVDDVLRGQVAGLTVQGSSGQAGAGSILLLRGLGSLEGRNTPLIYVDGIRIQSGVYNAGGEAQSNATALNSIDPADIARIEVIKGAAATTLYGTEAGAGVIQIFTKRGAAGPTRWTFSTGQSLAQPTHVGPESDPTGLHINDCTANGPIPSDTIPGADPGCPSSGSWLRNAWSQNYQLQAQGGNESVTFFTSGTYSRREGIVNAPDPYDPQNASTVNLRANFSFNSFDNLDVRLNNSYTRRDIRWIPDGDNVEGLMWNVTRLDQGETPDDDDSQVFDMELDQDIDHFTTGVNLSWTPRDNLRHRLNAGMDWTNSNDRTERPFQFWNVREGTRTVDVENSRIITLDYAGSWNYQLPRDLSSTLSWGGQFTDREALGLRGDCEGFVGPGNKVTENCDEITNLNEDRQGFKNGGVFLQERIGWRNRLFVTGGLRADTHSSFGDDLNLDQQFVMYPKLQATYTLSDHAFWPSWWQTMRLRAAYGESGEPPNPRASQTFYQIAGADEDEQGFIIQNLANPNITAERTAEFEAGIDAALLDGRVNLSGTVYDRQTTDGIVNIDLAASQGLFEVFPLNVGSWSSKGFETTLDVIAVDIENFRFNANARYQYTNTEMLELGPDEDNSFTVGFDNRFKVGNPFPAMYGQIVTNPDAEGVLPEFADTVMFQGQTIPPKQLSIGTMFTFFNRLTLDVNGFGQFGHVLLDDQAQELATAGLWPDCVDTNLQVEAWYDNDEPAGGLDGLTAGEIAKCSQRYARNADWVFDADYFRIQSARLSYRLPESWLPASISGATVQLQAHNLAMFTDYPGTDPDALITAATFVLGRSSGYTLPRPRVYGLNIRVNF